MVVDGRLYNPLMSVVVKDLCVLCIYAFLHILKAICIDYIDEANAYQETRRY